MKKIIISVVVILICNLAFAQQHKSYLKKYLPTGPQKNSYAAQTSHRGASYPHLAKVYGWEKSSGTWSPDYAIRYVYASDGTLQYEFEMMFDLSDTVNKVTTILDNYGFSTLEMYESKITQGYWQTFGGLRSTLGYYAPAKLSVKTEEVIDYNRPKWTNDYKTEYTHDGSGKLTYYIEQEWDSNVNDWNTGYKYEFHYDGSGKNDQITGTYWENSKWNNEMLVLVSWHKFNPYNMDIFDVDSAIMQEWDPVESKYVNAERIITSWDANGGYIQTYYLWQDEWILSDRYTLINDAQGNTIKDKGEQWNGSSWDLNWDYEYVLTYTSGNLTEKIEKSREQGDTALVNYYKYIYSEFNGISESTQTELLMYPNPCSRFIRVELPETVGQQTISLTDLSGKTLMRNNYQNHKDIVLDLVSIPSGTYILSIQTEKSVVSQLLVKR